MTITPSRLTAFQPDILAFQSNAFQVIAGNGLSEVSVVEIKPIYANVTADETVLTLANVSIVEIST